MYPRSERMSFHAACKSFEGAIDRIDLPEEAPGRDSCYRKMIEALHKATSDVRRISTLVSETMDASFALAEASGIAWDRERLRSVEDTVKHVMACMVSACDRHLPDEVLRPRFTMGEDETSVFWHSDQASFGISVLETTMEFHAESQPHYSTLLRRDVPKETLSGVVACCSGLDHAAAWYAQNTGPRY